MKRILYFLGLIFMAGCVSVPSSPTGSQPLDQMKIKLADLSFLRIGMPYSDVLEKVKGGIQLGYQMKDSQNGEPIIIKNPYREEVLVIQDKNYRISYILTYITRSDGFVSDDELTPLIFENDKLTAYGHDELFNLRKNIR